MAERPLCITDNMNISIDDERYKPQLFVLVVAIN